MRHGQGSKDQSLKYELQTITDIETGSIQQSLDSKFQSHMTWVANTREKQIREALIQLGWTPPL